VTDLWTAREAEITAVLAVRARCVYAYNEREQADADMDALIRAVAARAALEERARLLASGTPLWVATDQMRTSYVCASKAVAERQQIPHWSVPQTCRLPKALTPPGTVHQAVLLLLPEAEDG
jgi:hypothetical protein